MDFKTVANAPCGMRFMLDDLRLHSAAGRRRLLESPMLCSPEQILQAYARLREFCDKFPEAGLLGVKLGGLHDVRGTVSRLAGGAVLGDVEFFEIKSLALLSGQAAELLHAAGIDSLSLPDLEPLCALLDPEGTRIPAFHVYDAYSDELRALRQRIRTEEQERDRMLVRSLECEERIRRSLSNEAARYALPLAEALETLAEADILLAKADQMRRLGLCFPSISEQGPTRYRGIFHPAVQAELRDRGREFHPVELEFGTEPVTVVGANMGGKTVVLKMAALAQYLFQFGFGIPAAQASIRPCEQVCLRIGDAVPETGGLSSFAAEVRELDAMIDAVRSGRRVLVLADEPARTTNPAEGSALVTALVNLLGRGDSSVLITTHYDLHGACCRRLKVRGLQPDGTMDYSLCEVPPGRVPREAIAVARTLGADAEWLVEAERITTRINETNNDE